MKIDHLLRRGIFLTILASGFLSFFMLTPVFAITLRVTDQTALQRGARLFMNYCSGCHSLQYLRYSQMGVDLGVMSSLSDTRLLKNNLIFTTVNVQDPIRISMPARDARQWFGRMPPDLSLTAREKGADWIYTYLSSFYADRTRPFGSNNLLMPDTSMPNILEPLAGVFMIQQMKNEPARLLLMKEGSMHSLAFDSALIDLVSFLSYTAEPAQLVRYRIGVGVLCFLGVLGGLLYLLKRTYWK